MLKVHLRAYENFKYEREKKKYDTLLYKKFGNKYLYTKAYFWKKDIPIKLCCRTHGYFTDTPENLIKPSHQGCPKCKEFRKTHFYGSKKYGISLFRYEATKKNGHLFDYSRTVFKGFHKPITVVCHEHGFVRYKIPLLHLQKEVQCYACKGKKTRQTTEQWIEKANLVHDNKYIYTDTHYLSSREPISIICPIHGKFTLNRASDHTLSGVGCNICNTGGYNSSLPGLLYYLSINNGQAYKIGITNNTVQTRFGSDMQYIKIVSCWEYLNGKEALQKEQEILRTYKDYKYVGAPLLKNGNTELFTIDVLGLDNKGT